MFASEVDKAFIDRNGKNIQLIFKTIVFRSCGEIKKDGFFLPSFVSKR